MNAGADFRDGNNSTALWKAAAKGFDSVINLLLDKGDDIDAREWPQSRTALDKAAKYGHASTVRLLLERGATIELPGSAGGIALQEARARGHLEVVQILEKAAEAFLKVPASQANIDVEEGTFSVERVVNSRIPAIELRDASLRVNLSGGGLCSHSDYYSDDTIYPDSIVATLWEYAPRAADEFRLQKGDMLKVIGFWDDGWATGWKIPGRAEYFDLRSHGTEDALGPADAVKVFPASVPFSKLQVSSANIALACLCVFAITLETNSRGGLRLRRTIRKDFA